MHSPEDKQKLFALGHTISRRK